MILDLRVDAWRGRERLARLLPVVSWEWSEKTGAMPAGRLTADFPGDLWPLLVDDPLRPMGQTLRCEIAHDAHVSPLPAFRISEVSEGRGVVSVTADSIDGDIADDPWPFPSSPATGATLLREVTRLAHPIPVRLAVPDAGLPEGLAWSGDRDDALLELAAARSAQWRLTPDGALVLVPLGNPAEPDRAYGAREVTSAPRKMKRDRVSKATVVTQASGDDPVQTLIRALTERAFQPDLYGVVGRVQSIRSGATVAEMEAAADTMLAEGGGQREVEISADPTLRAGMVARLDIERTDGVETVIGRVVSHALAHTGTHTITIQEA